jgi:hypothetical protein
MWILNFLPEWVFHGLFLIGLLGTIAGFLLGMIPVIKQYLIPIRTISIVLLVVGTYLEGGLADNQVWQNRVKEVEAKLAKAEAESAKANTDLVQKADSKTAKVKEKTLVVKQYIDREVTKYDKTCIIPQPFIKAHNDAAEGPTK